MNTIEQPIEQTTILTDDKMPDIDVIADENLHLRPDILPSTDRENSDELPPSDIASPLSTRIGALTFNPSPLSNENETVNIIAMDSQAELM